jgi:hypothetical protein
VQKVEDGLPLFSSSGFYLLSSKEYPALDMLECFTQLQDAGSYVMMLTRQQLDARQSFTLSSELDLEILTSAFEAALDDSGNLTARHDAAMNKKRSRGVARAKEEAEDSGEAYSGVPFKEVTVSKKDGNPFIHYAWAGADGVAHEGSILREAIVQGDKMPIRVYFTAAEALEHFTASAEYRALVKALESGDDVRFAFAQGHVMRTSVSFRRKCENVRNSPAGKPLYGDAVYIHAADNHWTTGLVAVMHSMHPNFPSADYDAHHYVASCRQAEIGMNKVGDKWSPPQGVRYDLAKVLLS